MAGNLIGEPFRSYVNEQIKARQEIHGKTNRTTKEIQYLNSRNAWIKLASAVFVEQKRLDLLEGNPLLNGIHKGQDLAINNVLFNGSTRFGNTKFVKNEMKSKAVGLSRDGEQKDFFDPITEFSQQQRSGIKGSNRAYGVGGTGQFGYSPMPGIIDMNFKCLNRGSIKKATLNIKAHNKNQFDVIDVLYLRLGYSVFLEWGYDKYIDNSGNLQNMGDTLIDGPFWEDKYQKSDYSKWLPEIEKMRKETNGNYDGAFGVISNFSWTFEDDGTYNINLEIINLGDVIESLKVNLPSIVPDGANPYYAQRLAGLIQEVGQSSVSEEQFYNLLYPGLRESIIDWYDRSIEGRNSDPVPAINFSIESADQLRNKSFVYDDELSFSNSFFTPGTTNLWENTEITKVVGNDNFELPQSIISDAVGYALGKYYGPNFLVGYGTGFDEDGNSIVLGREGILPLNSTKLKGVGKFQEGYVGNTTIVDRNLSDKWEYTSNNQYRREWTLYFPYTINGELFFEDYGVVEEGYNKTIFNSTSGRYNWNLIFRNLPTSNNNKDKWNFILGNTVKAGKNADVDINFGISKRTLLTEVYNFFKKEKKASAIPKTEKMEELAELDDNEGNLSTEDEQKKKLLQQQVDQEVKDYQNKNKNRIYRFFYDIRNPDEQFAQQLELQDGADITLFGDVIVGKRKQEPQLTSASGPFNMTDGPHSISQAPIIQLNFLPLDNQWYIRLGSFLEHLQESVIPKIDTGEPMMKIDTGLSSNICYVINNVISTNPKKCIIKNQFFLQGVDENGNEVGSPIFNGAENYIRSLKTGGGNAEENKILYWGQIMNIYFSFTRLEEIFDSVNERNEVSLYKALKDICTDINESMGNINNIEPIVNEDNIVKFIDQTPIPGVKQIANELGLDNFKHEDREAILEIYGYNVNKNTSNFVRKVGLTTEISKNYATMITIGATANGSIPGVEATAFSRWNIGLKDRFKNNVVDANETNLSTPTSPISSSASTQIRTKYATLIQDNYARFGIDEDLNINDKYIKYNQGVVEDMYKLMQGENSFETDQNGNPINSIESSIGFLPFNLKLDLDGISGIKIYNRVQVNVDFLPSNYPDTLEFIITGVNHRLSDNDWITSLETTATSKNFLDTKKKTK
jgi:hypothetical protein